MHIYREFILFSLPTSNEVWTIDRLFWNVQLLYNYLKSGIIWVRGSCEHFVHEVFGPFFGGGQVTRKNYMKNNKTTIVGAVQFIHALIYQCLACGLLSPHVTPDENKLMEYINPQIWYFCVWFKWRLNKCIDWLVISLGWIHWIVLMDTKSSNYRSWIEYR